MTGVVTALGISFTTTAGTKTTTGTPAVGDLIVIGCANTGRGTANAPTVTDSNAGSTNTYTQVLACTNSGSTNSMWMYVRDTLITSASATTFTMTQASDSGGGLKVFKITGMTRVGVAAVRGTGVQSNQAAGGTPTPALPGAALVMNPTIGAVFNATSGSKTPPTGWTEDSDVGYSSPTTGIEFVRRDSGSSSTLTTWGATSATAFCSCIAEFDATFVKTGKAECH